MNDALAGANVSRIVRLLERHGGEMDAIELVESGMATGLSSEDAAEAIRRMLDRGEVGLTGDMHIRLLRQPA